MHSRAAHLTATAVALLTTSACLEPTTIVCDSQNLCPPGLRCVAGDVFQSTGDRCVATECGDGLVNKDAGEQCDEGLKDTRLCNGLIGVEVWAVCQVARCGDGHTNRASGEACDDGLNGAPRETRTCNADCTEAKCGDSEVNRTRGESCDDGVDGGPRETETCNLDCTRARCGDGQTNHTAGEECDRGGAGVPRETSDCNIDCTYSKCGDGKVNLTAGEECDYGWDDSAGLPKETSGCNVNCRISRCGDGKTNTTAGERCDKGEDGGPKETAECNLNCTERRCGDFVVNHTAGEQCDEGGVDTPTCNADCTIAKCGDGKTNYPADEQCDDGWDSDAGRPRSTERCGSDCKSATCGNGLVDNGEQCDTRGESAICNHDCTVARCGDGQTNATAHEQCDDGKAGRPMESATCNADCTKATCGDGTVNHAAHEQCDDGVDGGPRETKTCNLDCTLATCGDGKTNTAAGEACDDGNTDDGDDCLGTCRFNTCGDGRLHVRGVREHEVCDLGDRNGATACEYGTKSCLLCDSTCGALDAGVGPYCGDGLRSGAEACDHAEANGCGTCTASCTTVAPSPAQGSLTVPAAPVGGESFMLDDGVNPPVVFEVALDGAAVAPSRVRVDLSSTFSSAELAQRLEAAIASVHERLWIRATAHVGTGHVALSNELPGRFGNRAVWTSGLSASGMSGGAGHGCQGGTGCRADDDCAPGLVCEANRCTSQTSVLEVSTTQENESHGMVTSDRGAIACAPSCIDAFPVGTLVVLTATPDQTTAFLGWADGGCAGTGQCQVRIAREGTVVAARFARVVLTVAKGGSGAGTITSSSGPIDCGETCSAIYPRGEQVTLMGTPDLHMRFDGWHGAGCPDAGDCTVTMDGPRSVTAEFSHITHALEVHTTGAGAVTVATGLDGGMVSCDAPTCGATFNEATSVVLTAAPGEGRVFAGWAGDCVGNEPTCPLVMDGDKSVSATFN